jgi:glutaredoxin
MHDYNLPKKSEFTLYSKSGCHNCLKIKQFLKESHLSFSVVDCDEYLLENREQFLNFVKELAKTEIKSFPIVFDHMKYIGGYDETIKYVNEMKLAFVDFDMSF